MIKRTKFYSVVHGVAVENGELHDVQVVVDGRVRTADKAMKRAKKLNPDMLPTTAEYHAQVVSMDDKEFFEHGQYGEDTIIDYPGPIDVAVDDDIIDDDADNTNE